MLLRLVLLAAALFGMSLAAPAADFEKYLLNDTDAVVTVHVKQFVASPLFQKHYQKLVQDWLKNTDEVAKALTATGFDPLKDIDWVVAANGESLYRLEKKIVGKTIVPENYGGAFALVQGRFDPAKVQAWADKASYLKATKVGSSSVYEWKMTPDDPKAGPGRVIYFAVLDKTVAAVSTNKDPVVEAVEKAQGKRKTALKYAQAAAAAAKLDPKKTVQVYAGGNTVYGLDLDLLKVGNKVIEKIVKMDLNAEKISGVTGSIVVAEDIKADFTVGILDAKVGKAVAESLEKDRGTSIEAAFAAVFQNKAVAPVLELLKAIKCTATAKSVAITAEVTAEAVEKALK